VNGDNETFKKFFHSYYRKELYCAIGLWTWFITDALSYEDLDFTIQAIDKISKLF
jgi:glutamate-1-semialdehyde 2,1-aminomutase